MIVEVVLVAGAWLLLGLIAGRGSPVSVVVVAIGGALAVWVSMSPMLLLVAADAMLSAPVRQDPGVFAWATGAVMGSLVGAPAALLCWIAAPPPRRAPPGPAATFAPPPGATAPPQRFRRTGRAEPPVESPPAPAAALTAERMAEIEAEERYRAEVRARLAAERGEGG